MAYKRDVEDVVIDDSSIRFPLKDKTVTIPFDEVIACDVILPKNEESDRFCCGGRRHIATVTVLQGYIQLFYIHHSSKKDFLWKKKELHVKAIPERCYEIQRKIDAAIERGDRPKTLLVLINPISGKKNGVKVFRKILSPLFDLAKIKAEVKVTERAKHMAEIVNTFNLDSVDGIVIIGGDGSACEVLNAMVKKSQGAVGEPITEISPIQKSVSIIPLGSANGFAEDLYGISDAATAALHIIKGKQRMHPLLGIYSGGEFVSCSCALVCSGLFSDMMYHADRHRKFGTKRYMLIGCWLIVCKSHPEYDATVTYYTTSPNEEDGNTVQIADQKDLRGRFISFTNFNGSILDLETNKQYPTMADKHKGNQNPTATNLLVYKDARGMHILKQMMDMTKRTDDSLSREFLDVINSSSYTVHIDPPQSEDNQNKKYQVNGSTTEGVDIEYDACSCVAVDGEIFSIKDNTFEVRLHSQAVSVFSSS